MSDKSERTPQEINTTDTDDFSIAAGTFGVFDADNEEASERPRSALARLTAWTSATHAVDYGFAGETSFIEWAKDYGSLWARQLIAAAVIAVVCNGIWRIPLYQVVDVNLAWSLSWAALNAAALVLILGYEVLNGFFRDALESIVLIVALALLPFGAILGYAIYGWLGGEEATNASFVYKLYVGMFAQGYGVLASAANWDVFGVIREQKDSAGVVVTSVNASALATWIGIISGSMAIINYLLNWMRRAAA